MALQSYGAPREADPALRWGVIGGRHATTMTTAVFIGDGTLLIQCAGVYLDAGHQIQAIASGNQAVLTWARSHSLATVQTEADARIELPGLSFDYLFSVANLRV